MRRSGTVPRLTDLAVNLTDCFYRGVDWSGRRCHEDDFDLVLQRAVAAGVRRVVITGTSLAQSTKAVALCRRHAETALASSCELRCTVGVHPAHCAEFLHPLDMTEVKRIVADDASIVAPHNNTVAADTEADETQLSPYTTERLRYLAQLIEQNRDLVVAVGEIGLDEAETAYCPSAVQERYLLAQLRALAPLQLPFLFHSRDCGMRLVTLLEHSAGLPAMRGVVHSFNGSLAEQEAWLRMGYYISLNGSAFRLRATAEQVTRIPLQRVLLETDGPWCDLRPKDYGYAFVHTHYDTRPRKRFERGKCVERRNEPCHLVQVLEAYVGCKRAAGPYDATDEWCAIASSPQIHDEVAAVIERNYTALFCA